MIAVGCTCTCRQVPNVTWVVKRRITLANAGDYWQLIAKQRRHYIGRIASEGDLVELTPAPAYSPGATVAYQGLDNIVIEDKGDEIEVGVPDSTKPLRGGGLLHIPAGNRLTISKADLRLEEI